MNKIQVKAYGTTLPLIRLIWVIGGFVGDAGDRIEGQEDTQINGPQ